jgi:hypothetical protein
MNPLVTLRCPRCKAEKQSPCDDFDPYGTAVVQIICPDCDDGDFHAPEFFDESGNWIDPLADFEAGEAA